MLERRQNDLGFVFLLNRARDNKFYVIDGNRKS